MHQKVTARNNGDRFYYNLLVLSSVRLAWRLSMHMVPTSASWFLAELPVSWQPVLVHRSFRPAHYSFATFTSHFTSEWCRLPSSWTTGLRSRSNHRKKSEKRNFDSLVNAYRRRDIGATWLLISSNNNIRRGRLRGIIRQKVVLLCNMCKDKLEMWNRILSMELCF